MLIRLLRRIFTSDVVLLASSNYAPESLLPSLSWHHIFPPGIDLILQKMETVELVGDTDWTMGQASLEAGTGWLRGRGSSWPTMEYEPRNQAKLLACGCGNGSSPWWLHDRKSYGLPSPRRVRLRRLRLDPEAQQRFINLVDIVCDRGMPMYITSGFSLEELSTMAEGRPDALRMLSWLLTAGNGSYPGNDQALTDAGNRHGGYEQGPVVRLGLLTGLLTRGVGSAS